MSATKRWNLLGIFGAVATLALPAAPLAAGADSAFLELGADFNVDVGPVTVLSAVIQGGQSVFVDADGRYYPSGGPVAADVYLTLDGVKISNDSFIDWRFSTNMGQHAFNAIAALQLPAGAHTIAMVASSTGAFTIGANSALSVVTKPAASLAQNSLARDSGIIQWPQPPYPQTFAYGDPLPMTSLLRASVTVPSMLPIAPIIALGSGRIYYAGSDAMNYGDALLNLSIDGPVSNAQFGCQSADPSGQCNNTSSWADNDTWIGAETQSPVYLHAYFSVPTPGAHTVSLDGTAEPYGAAPDAVQYEAGAGSTLVLLTGGMKVFGIGSEVQPGLAKGGLAPAGYGMPYLCVATTQVPVPSFCSAAGSSVKIAGGSFTVPATGHNGVVFFEGKTRIQGDCNDGGGNALLWLEVDGALVGSVGVQQIHYNNGDSTRTLTASYLAAGSHALKPGPHTVQLFAEGAPYPGPVQGTYPVCDPGAAPPTTGSFKWLSVTQDLSLIWFD